MSEQVKPGWYIRLENEYSELRNKIYKLRVFINSEKFENTSSASQHLLTTQLLVMKQYLNVLEERIFTDTYE